MSIRYRVTVEGLDKVIKTFADLDDEAKEAFRKNLRQAGDIITRDARKRIPTGATRGGGPLSRWTGGGRTRNGFPQWTTATKERNSIKAQLFEKWPGRQQTVVEVKEGGAAAVVFDLAGKKTSASESQFVANLQARYGIQPRGLKRTEIEKLDEAQRKAQRSIEVAFRNYFRRRGL